MKAKKALELREDYLRTDYLLGIFKRIENAAAKGEWFINVDNRFSNEMQKDFRELGYTIVMEPDSTGECIISWKVEREKGAYHRAYRESPQEVSIRVKTDKPSPPENREITFKGFAAALAILIPFILGLIIGGLAT